jgi:hypothetical protein
MNRSKVIVAGIVAVLVTGIGVINVYIPLYSQTARDRRNQVSIGTVQRPPQESAGAGSMWTNVKKAEDAVRPRFCCVQ